MQFLLTIGIFSSLESTPFILREVIIILPIDDVAGLEGDSTVVAFESVN
jgi:hypothetical protein